MPKTDIGINRIIAKVIGNHCINKLPASQFAISILIRCERLLFFS